VVTGFEEEHGDARLNLERHVEHDHILGLEAAGDACALRVGSVLADKVLAEEA
jgi:hypothetical protein